ncbi:MAG: heparinase II/III family protein [Alphaproteobacteria bacterium]
MMIAARYTNPLHRLLLVGPVPDEIIGNPTDIVPGDAGQGTAILGGQFALGGHKIQIEGNTPWRLRPPRDRWHTQLYGFSWLRDLRAVGSARARKRAQEIVASWIDTFGEWDQPSWRPQITGRRLAAWLTHGDFLLKDADAAFARLFFKSAVRQGRYLARAVRGGDDGAARLSAIKGLIYSGICLPRGERRAALGARLLEQELLRQILSDGGHCERSPSLQLAVLKDLVDLRQTLLGSHREPPPSLQGAVDRMAPLLRTFRHGDGRLALFNDGSEEDVWLIDLVLAQADAKGRPLVSAPHTGFQSIQAGRTALIVDAGRPSPVGRRAHAGTLSFEMSVGKDRMIVNCGGYVGPDAAWRRALRATAAHSTLSVDETSSSEIRDDASLGDGPRKVTIERKESDGNIWLDTSHDGYLHRLGVIHRRRFYLSADGGDVRGEDVLIRRASKGKGARHFNVRFHLHPDVHASMVQDGSAVLIRLPGGAGWQMRAAGGRLGLSESVYLSAPGNRRRTEQIVIEGEIAGETTTTKWAFRRVGQGSD